MTSKPKNMAIGRRAKRLWSGFKGLFRKPPPPEVALAPSFQRLEEAIHTLRVEFSTQLSFHTYDLAEELQTHFDATRSSLASDVQSHLKDLRPALQDGIAALEQRIDAIGAGVQQLGNSSFELTNRVIGLDTGLNSRLNTTDGKVFELDNKVSHASSALQSRLNELESAAIVREAANGGSARVVGDLAQLRQQVGEAAIAASNSIGRLENSLLTRVNEVDARSFESANRVLHLQSELHLKLAEISQAASELRNSIGHVDSSLGSRLNELVFLHIPSVLEQIHEAASLQITALEGISPAPSDRTARPAPAKGETFDAVLARARQDFPTVYGEWRSRLDTMGAAFDETKIGNAAHAGDSYSRLFRSFVSRHIRGPVLDVGCGPFGRPYYLTGYPAKLISGLEPLPFPPNDEIQILRGISEYLPWTDGAFDTVISGTSLDHCLSLDRSLDEMFRVLAPHGVALLWLGHIPGSPQFKPLDPGFTPADQFHLFHFDIAWFEPMLGRRFEILDRVKLDRAGYSHVFYALRPIPGSAPYDQSGARAAAKAVDAGGKGRKVTAGSS